MTEFTVLEMCTNLYAYSHLVIKILGVNLFISINIDVSFFLCMTFTFDLLTLISVDLFPFLKCSI